jgi:hypothetical protein
LSAPKYASSDFTFFGGAASARKNFARRPCLWKYDAGYRDAGEEGEAEGGPDILAAARPAAHVQTGVAGPSVLAETEGARLPVRAHTVCQCAIQNYEKKDTARKKELCSAILAASTLSAHVVHPLSRFRACAKQK